MSKTVTMECSHTTILPVPNLGTLAYCYKCAGYQKLIAIVAPYHIRCDKCTYSRNNNVSTYQAMRVASRHTMNTGHSVTVTQAGDVVGRTEDQPSLPSCDMIPY